MSSDQITKYINLMLGRDEMNITVSKVKICRVLKQEYDKQRKNKKE